MDAKVFRMAILMIISAFILVLVIVYATNVDKLSALFGGGKEKSGSQSTEEVSIDEQVSGKFSPTQIGDNLSGFELDADFFDPTERVPTVVVRKKNTESGDLAEAAGAAELASERESTGTGMAIVGELINPNLEAGYYSTGNFNPYSSDATMSDTGDGAMGEAGGYSSYDTTLSTGAITQNGASSGIGSSAQSISATGSTGTSMVSSGTPAGSASTPAGSSGTSMISSGTPAGSASTPAGLSGTPAGSSGTPVDSTSTPLGSSGTPAGSTPGNSLGVSSATVSSSTGYLTGTYDDYIPASQTITGTPVGIP